MIILIILCIILIIGFIRILTRPYTGIINFIIEVMMMDYLSKTINTILNKILDILEED